MTLFFAIIVVSLPQLRSIYLSSESSNEKTIIKKRLLFFDVVKGIAILAVILIHTLVIYKLTQTKFEKFIYILNNIIRFAVPVFLISTGILLNPKKVENNRGILKFYVKKIFTIFIPYSFTTLVISLYLKVSISVFFYYLISGKALGPYYYIIVLAQLYLLYPILVKIKNNKWFLPVSFSISLISYLFEFTWHLYGITLFMPFLYFFSYGIANRNYFLNSTSKKHISLPFFLLVIVYLIFSILWTDYYYNMVYVFGVAVWNLFFIYQYELTTSWFTKLLAKIGKISLWIYFVHFSVILLMCRLLDNSNIFLYIVSTYLISVAISYYLAKFLYVLYENVAAKVTKDLSKI